MKYSKETLYGLLTITVIGVVVLCIWFFTGMKHDEWMKESLQSLNKGDVLMFVLIIAFALYNRK
ncbi:MAG: hypothetical protein WC389_15635 [Lutibacter sp.]|jgi:threonine/homoserine/homoserine lactone efflux protein